MRVNNRDMGAAVTRMQEFTNSHKTAWSVRRDHCYVVFSYGEHFPMYVYDFELGQWFGNSDKYSRTTSCHMSQACPDFADIVHVDTDTMCQLAGGNCKDKARAYLLGRAQQGD